MKKIFALVLCLILVLSVTGNSVVMATENISVKLDGEVLVFDVPPQLVNGRTMVPMRVIFEKLGATVEWDAATETVTSVRGDTTVKLTIGVPNITINRQSPKELDTAPCVINGRTLVPVRAVAEAFNLDVGWVTATSTVLITSPDKKVNSYERMKETILSSEFVRYSDGIPFLAYKPYSENEMTFIYDSKNEAIFLRYRWLEYPAEEVTIIIYPDKKPWLNFVLDPDGVGIKASASFEEAGKPPVIKSNEFPADLDWISGVYLDMGLMDLFMKNVTGMTFEDFGIYYIPQN